MNAMKKRSVSKFKWWPLHGLKSELSGDDSDRSCFVYAEVGYCLGENLYALVNEGWISNEDVNVLTGGIKVQDRDDVHSWLKDKLPEFLEHIPYDVKAPWYFDEFLGRFIECIRDEYQFLLPADEAEMSEEEIEEFYSEQDTLRLL